MKYHHIIIVNRKFYIQYNPNTVIGLYMLKKIYLCTTGKKDTMIC